MQIKKNPKADLGKGSMIFFQIGLILVLSVTYFGLEYKFEDRKGTDTFLLDLPDLVQEDIPITQINVPPPPPPPPPPAMPEIIEVIKDLEDKEETQIESSESHQDLKLETVVKVEDVNFQEEEEEIEKMPFVLVEQIPIFPGCEKIKGKAEQRECMSNSIDAHVKKHFNTRISEELGLSGLNRIYVVFKINEKGEVADIRTRAPNKRLEQEVARVVNLLPKMVPGRQRDKPVAVEYSLPIVYEIREQI